MRLIDADKLNCDMTEKVFNGDGVYKVFGYSSTQIKSAPTVSYSDVIPHGQWLVNKEAGYVSIAPCSNCGKIEDID